MKSKRGKKEVSKNHSFSEAQNSRRYGGNAGNNSLMLQDPNYPMIDLLKKQSPKAEKSKGVSFNFISREAREKI